MKPGETLVRPSAPAMYREFIEKYDGAHNRPDLRPKPVQKPRLVEATPQNLATLTHIKERENKEIVYTPDEVQWGKSQQWDAAETGKGDCEDFATFALIRCMEAGFPREACLITIAVDANDVWHLFLTVRTTKGDFCIDNQWNRPVTPQEQKTRGYTQCWHEDPYGRTDDVTGTYKWVWSPYGN